MISKEIQKNVDEKWAACWPLSDLRPEVILDLISFLFFFKKISEPLFVLETSENKKENQALSDSEECTWTVFKNLPPHQKFEAFTREKGVADVIKNYDSDLKYSQFVKAGLLMDPTPKSLTNACELIKIIEKESDQIKAEIFDYLLNKTAQKSSNGQVFLSKNIVHLIVNIIQPNEKDIIFDPSAGNGSFLIESAKYIARKSHSNFKNEKTIQEPSVFMGLESDWSQLRIAAMNMMLNGLDSSKLQFQDVLSAPHINLERHPSLIISNLLFLDSEKIMRVEGNMIKEAVRKEIYFLDLILKTSRNGTKVCVVTSLPVFFDESPDIQEIRKKIIDDFRLEAVIYLNTKNTSEFPNAGIIIFSKQASSVTEKVWVYKIKTHQNEVDNSKEFEKIINHFKLHEKNENKNTGGFYLEVEKLRSINYSLNYKEYGLPINIPEPEKSFDISPIRKELPDNKRAKEPTANNTQNLTPVVPQKKSRKNLIIIASTVLVLCVGILLYLFIGPKKENQLSATNDSISVTENAPVTESQLKTDTQQNDVVPGNTDLNSENYSVISKAYFYSSPDEKSIEKIYINHWSNAVLSPQKEENGFIYVTYSIKPGENISGWLNKKDLQKLP